MTMRYVIAENIHFNIKGVILWGITAFKMDTNNTTW